jgi:NTP pyrophosphatase (non-canonical NTP hydrolase)
MSTNERSTKRAIAAHPIATDAASAPAPTLNELAAEIVEINRANGWNVTRPEDWPRDAQDDEDSIHKIGTKLALITSEVSEALEGLRDLDKENFAEELSDVLIRTLDLAGGLGLDVDGAVFAKLEKNRGRGYRHGGAPYEVR